MNARVHLFLAECVVCLLLSFFSCVRHVSIPSPLGGTRVRVEPLSTTLLPPSLALSPFLCQLNLSPILIIIIIIGRHSILAAALLAYNVPYVGTQLRFESH